MVEPVTTIFTHSPTASMRRNPGYVAIFGRPISSSHRPSADCPVDSVLQAGEPPVQRLFQARGAFNKILSLSAADRKRGIVTSSSGNHGAGVAYALGTLGQAGTVFVPTNVSPGKARNIEQLGGP
ncbi:MAG: hypothetical protein CM1200mP20_05100 [Pseudomonadota bacterium]|nr:MAG: hypothetical protein CM1200mP20_05100 [Pseudomonadota bacterium]